MTGPRLVEEIQDFMAPKTQAYLAELPKLYLECGHCDSPGVSITVLLTGRSSGEASLQLKLGAAHFAAKHSHGEAQQDMAAHYGQDIERTKLRRMALQVEKRAVDYAEAKRAEVLKKLSGEARTSGVPTLMVEADGGMIRTGLLVDLDPEDPGYGEETKRGKPRRKRPTQYRELITMDVREPGQLEPTPLDVLVPVGAPQGERSRRLLALAGRGGLADNTHVKGLGDLGSGLPAAFDEAFVGYQADFSADWKHISDWENFKHSELAREQSHFAKALQTRLQQAVDKGRLGPGVMPDTDSPRPAAEQADSDQSQACAG